MVKVRNSWRDTVLEIILEGCVKVFVRWVVLTQTSNMYYITWTKRLFCGWHLLWWVMLNICLQKYKHKHKYMKSLNKDLMQWTAWWSGCSFSIWEWGFSSIQKKICGSLWGGVPWKCEKSRIWGNSERGLCDRIDGSLEGCPGTVLALGLGKEWSGGRGRQKMSDILGRQVSQRQAGSAGASVRVGRPVWLWRKMGP